MPKENGRRILRIFTQISLKFIPNISIDKKSTSVQLTAWGWYAKNFPPCLPTHIDTFFLHEYGLD